MNTRKKVIVLTARVHPGETVASFKIQGLIKYLLSDYYQVVMMRKKFVFIIIPMLNPDGVINGNYRCNLAGNDLNRNWDTPSEVQHPTIFNAKKLIKHMGMMGRLSLYCDFHGHSKKKNSFFYGCHNKEKPYASREFPYIM